MDSTNLFDLFFVLLFANTCTCLICNNGTAYVDVNGTVTPIDINIDISCTTQCVVNDSFKQYTYKVTFFLLYFHFQKKDNKCQK